MPGQPALPAMAEKDKEPLLGYTGAFRRPNYKF